VTTFTERLEQARIARGLSRIELSRMIGLCDSAVQKLVEDESSPRMVTVMAMCRALNIPLTALAEGLGWEELERQWQRDAKSKKCP
jgi:transcriptional regulator with XRE-family HTH domain